MASEENQFVMLEIMEGALLELEDVTSYARENDLPYADEALLKQWDWHESQLKLLTEEVREKMIKDGIDPVKNGVGHD